MAGWVTDRADRGEDVVQILLSSISENELLDVHGSIKEEHLRAFINAYLNQARSRLECV